MGKSTRRITCNYGTCYFSLEAELPDDPEEAKSVVDELMASHREAVHPAQPPAEVATAPVVEPAAPEPEAVPEVEAKPDEVPPPPPPDETEHGRVHGEAAVPPEPHRPAHHASHGHGHGKKHR